ncbi:SCO family protein [Ferrimonas aestuarii]|uniref:SCO family protein n=1 Tax=Ferrimonas aestuarii TaxID=2569539 RepID=A0A4U1BQJ4_9GAMM|nr:SCO family protein [Ferrimonas aestuarii]TKB56250.1 SCO family protein [Ferrimonas aestuarii]
MVNLRWLYALVAVAALATGMTLSLSSSEQPKVSALWLPEPRLIKDFQLVDEQGQAFTQAQLTGQWTLLFMGFTSCPDVCPSTLARLTSIYPAVSKDMPVQVVLLSVDPQRDQGQKLKDYIQYFNPEFKAVTGEHAQLYALSRNLGLVYAMVDLPDGQGYSVDHSADIVLINPQGQLEAIFRPQGEPGELRLVSVAQMKQDLPIIADYRSY